MNTKQIPRALTDIRGEIDPTVRSVTLCGQGAKHLVAINMNMHDIAQQAFHWLIRGILPPLQGLEIL
jgi:hypothetical protein